MFEKYHKVFEAPVLDAAEAKIVESCRAVKALSKVGTECYMYTESDWARPAYSLGHWVQNNTESAVQCPAPGDLVSGFEDSICNSTDKSPTSDRLCLNETYYAYDFNNSAMREHWVDRVANVVATGHVDGAFIDGNRGGWSSNVIGPCSPVKKEGWAAGLSLAVATLAKRLGPTKTLISNYPTPEALASIVGGMMERGGSSVAIQEFGKNKDGTQKTCGLFNQPCLLDYHAQYFSHPADGKLASFLLGAQKYAYFGGGSGWGGPGASACALWLKMWPEYSKSLGEPLGDMKLTKASWPGAICDPSGGNHANTTGCLFTRAFKSGTQVVVGQYHAPFPDTRGPSHSSNRGSCIYWSDGDITTSNKSNCEPKKAFVRV